MKQELRGMGWRGGERERREGATESDMKREHKIEGEREEINYLSRLYGELQLPVVKMDLARKNVCSQVRGCTFVKELLFFPVEIHCKEILLYFKPLWWKLQQVTTWFIIC